MKSLSKTKCFEGTLEFFEHASQTTSTPMRFAVFLPPQSKVEKVPGLFWLSGLTCTEENFMQKSGAQRVASQLGTALIAPDTSPRGAGIAGESESWDFGLGAGFYLNATQAPWSKNYRMYDYILKEFKDLVLKNFPIHPDRLAISGHSMGGHGALVLGLRNPEVFKSISAFSPIVAPSECPWGQKAFKNYLGEDKATWKNYDACQLLRATGFKGEILVDQGTEDKFLNDQLMPEKLQAVARELEFPLKLRMQEGYDHSYYFVSSFIEDHLKFHQRTLSSLPIN
ncbi:S-formylglutathione hydrolase [bacterium]|nr:S-formylglutathione hydrolase [bacterium]